MKKDSELNIVVYDDICVLCTWSVQYIIRNDPEGKFYFASLSDASIRSYLDFGEEKLESESVILINKRGNYFYSDAALKILAQLDTAWSVIHLFQFIPKFIRDAVYKAIARYRYKI